TLTVGDGLVTQMPALIISTAAGILVTKTGVVGSTDKAVFGQLSGYPSAWGVSSFLMLGMSVLPGVPFIPFVILGGGAGAMAWFLTQRQEQVAARVLQEAQIASKVAPAPVAEAPIANSLQIDLVRIELGYGLLALVNNPKGGVLITDQIKALRRQLAAEMGFVMPSIRIQDNLQLPANVYVLRIKEIEAGRGDIRPGMLLVMDPRGQPLQLAGEATTEPTFGLPAMWVSEALREEAQFRGYTVVDAATVVTTHLTEIIKDNMSELLSYAEAQKLMEELGKEHQKLIAEVVPGKIGTGGIQRVLQNLLAERVSIRDLPTILEGIAEASGFSRSITNITEHVRARLARQLSESNTFNGVISLVTLSPEWEQTFAESLIGQGEDRQLSMAPSKLQQFIAAVRSAFDRFSMIGENPVLLTSPMVRPYVRSIVERFRPSTTVMSQNEVHPKARLKTLGQI
ncbi:MAG: FHIPEP family type III secretion protein, partial [Dongiaceae bacterium]